ncbi:hypothetical protein AOLI_G00014170 [Acnodon oligacanthus]
MIWTRARRSAGSALQPAVWLEAVRILSSALSSEIKLNDLRPPAVRDLTVRHSRRVSDRVMMKMKREKASGQRCESHADHFILPKRPNGRSSVFTSVTAALRIIPHCLFLLTALAVYSETRVLHQ